jgi:ATP-dependent protease Clp ATPase subunit
LLLLFHHRAEENTRIRIFLASRHNKYLISFVVELLMGLEKIINLRSGETGIGFNAEVQSKDSKKIRVAS